MIYYIKGDAVYPEKYHDKKEENRIIAHVCNNAGFWGLGFVLSLNRRSFIPRKVFLEARKNREENSKLSGVQFCQIDDYLFVANMVAQNGTRSVINPVPIKYDALEKCLRRVNRELLEIDGSLHIPKIGTGLAGGKWNRVVEIIEDTVEAYTYVYELE